MRLLWKIILYRIGHLEEMDKFPETNNFQKLNHQETKDLSKQTTKKEIQSTVKNLWKPDSFTGDSTKHQRRISTKYFSSSLKKQKMRKHFQTRFKRSAFPWQQTTKRCYRNKNYRQYPWWTLMQKPSPKY